MANEYGKRCLNPSAIRKMTNLCWDTHTHIRTARNRKPGHTQRGPQGTVCAAFACLKWNREGKGSAARTHGVTDSRPKLEGTQMPTSWWPDKQPLSAHIGHYSTRRHDLWPTRHECLSLSQVKEVRHKVHRLLVCPGGILETLRLVTELCYCCCCFKKQNGANKMALQDNDTCYRAW